jgi:serine/threonine protein kinase
MNAGIFIVRDRATGEACIKKDFKRREIEMGSAQNEIRILRSLKHRNIVDYIHAHLEEDPYVCKGSLYMELCEYGSVDNILDKHHEHNWGIGESAIWSSFKQLANAIGYIQHGIQDTVNGGHSVPGWRKILHRDIVPRNVFIKTSGHRNPRIVLGDFGISTIVDSIHVRRNWWIL